MINANINHIKFENFKNNIKKNNKVNLIFKKILRQNTAIIQSLKKNYKDKYNKKFVKKFNKFKSVNIFGIGGSILGSKAIYNFLSPSKKNFFFVDSFLNKLPKKIGQKDLNLIISKSGNTLETIANSNALIKNWKQTIFISENKKNYLTNLVDKLKSEIIHHNNFIGGRFSVLSEVGMLPAELMGYSPKKFRKFNELIQNKSFCNSLINNVSCLYEFYLKGKTNSIILNYDRSASDLFLWYQQLVAESLGKNNNGILPIISSMPSDNHSLMQYYLDGPKNHFFTFFFTKEKSIKIDQRLKIKSPHNIFGKTLNQISYSQFLATKKVFKEKNIPFRSFEISKKKEETIGSLFIYFILETILLGNLMKVNSFDQPSVELIKVETKKFL